MKIELEKLGWVVAAGLGAMVFASGFQGTNTKLGVVDVNKAITGSEGYTKGSDSFQAAYKLRGELLDFISTYPVFTIAQANRFLELSLKAAPTPVETAELNKLKADVKASDTKLRALQQKPPANLTPQDRTDLDDFGKRQQELGQHMGDWRQQFTDELQGMQDKAIQANQDSARNAIQEVGKNQAFSLIFSKDVAPYGQNDVTADVIKGMNKK